VLRVVKVATTQFLAPIKVCSAAYQVLSFSRCHGNVQETSRLSGENPPMGETSMRYYFHILTDQERLRDPDGEDFSSLAVARTEATQCARDLIAERLRCGRAAPSRWCIHVAQEDDTIVHTVPFAPLLLGEEDHGG
jgi:hypothetical protein